MVYEQFNSEIAFNFLLLHILRQKKQYKQNHSLIKFSYIKYWKLAVPVAIIKASKNWRAVLRNKNSVFNHLRRAIITTGIYTMKLSQIAFRFTFLALAIIYLSAISEFINPNLLNFDLNIRYDVTAITILVISFVYIFMKRSR